MPIYEYQCTECGNVFEELQSFSDKPITQCPICKGRVRKLVSKGVGLSFKGSGFYCTDYRSSHSSPVHSSCSSGCNTGSCSTCGTSSSSKAKTSKTAE
ncbi:MAG: FmdB family transcriptional regulator [Candidatus Atribacteria bacterium]|nr:FmdB family transcriptional regulator [Candidatus Atribacteria bacterium]